LCDDTPDIFYIEDNRDLRTFARSGFLVDIYTLIDADPHISRDDFFTEALRAFEINGRLFMLPISFGFQYVGINAGLPQEFIDRFTQHSTITFPQMIDLYIDLKTTCSANRSVMPFETFALAVMSAMPLRIGISFLGSDLSLFLFF